MYASDWHIPRNQSRRIKVIEVPKDDGPNQFITVAGLKNEVFRLAMNSQSFGFAEVPPVGSVGVLLAVNGRLDQGILIGMHHPDHRIKNQQPGEASVYGQPGNRVHMKANGDVEISGAGGGIVHINPPA